MAKCPETGRKSQADFYEMRVYSKALTASELASQNTASPAYTADSEYVQLWLDFDNIAEAPQDIPDEDILYGDADCDGKSDIADAVVLQKWLLNDSKFTFKNWKNIDMNGDGMIDVFDLIMLKKELIYE